jgi:hypothetical protein
MGAFFGNNVQVSLPAVVSMIASGAGAAAEDAVAGFFAVECAVGFVCEIVAIDVSAIAATNNLRM